MFILYLSKSVVVSFRLEDKIIYAINLKIKHITFLPLLSRTKVLQAEDLHGPLEDGKNMQTQTMNLLQRMNMSRHRKESNRKVIKEAVGVGGKSSPLVKMNQVQMIM